MANREQLTRAEIVTLMRDNWQDPVGFHESVCGRMEIDEEEYAPPEDDPIDIALAYYRSHYGPATREDIERAADPKRNYHTLAEITALEHAGIEVRR